MKFNTSAGILLQDIRQTFRSLRHNLAFASAVVFLLALGIGATTTIFSVIRAVILRPMPYGEPQRLARLWESNPAHGLPEFAASAPNFRDWQSQQDAFEELCGSELQTFNLTGDGDPERIPSAGITANLVPALGLAPLLGRSFLPEEEQPGRNHVALVSDALWQRRFGGDKALVGRAIQLGGQSYTVVGIMPAEFQFPTGRDLWVPLVLDPETQPWRADRSNHNLAVYGRLKPGVTLEQASAEMNIVANRLERQYPLSNTGWGIRVRSFYDWIVPEQIRRSIGILFVAVALLLLIACTNVANLLLTRSRARQRETAIKAALGASRGRLIGQFLTESLLLSGLGAAGGLWLTAWGTKIIASLHVLNISRLSETRIDTQVLVFAALVAILTGIVFGVAPGLGGSRVSLVDGLKSGGYSDVGRTSNRFRAAMIVAQVALSLTLMAAAGLMLRGFMRMQAVPLGFAPKNLLTMQLSLPTARYGERQQRLDFFDRLLEQLRSTPGIVDAAGVTQPPYTGDEWALPITLEGNQAGGIESSLAPASSTAGAFAATPHYFGAMSIPLLKGREFTNHDGAQGPLNLIVSDAFARRYWPNQDPIGKRFKPGPSNPFGTVVGVVGDVRTSSQQDEPQPAFYFPYAYIGMPDMVLTIRTVSDPEGISTAVREQLKLTDPQQPVYNIRTMDQILAKDTSQPRFQTLLLGLFSVMALVLAVFGIYSVMAHLAAQRKREIGVRMAIGASRADILRMILRQGMTCVSVGIGIGLAGSAALATLMGSLFFRIGPNDPLTLAAVVVLMFVVSLVACYLPALQATRTAPSTALRGD